MECEKQQGRAQLQLFMIENSLGIYDTEIRNILDDTEIRNKFEDTEIRNKFDDTEIRNKFDDKNCV